MSAKGHTTAMAGEFCVMERLFRLGHEAALTLGNAKTVDILTKAPTGNVFQVSVKATRQAGKWGIGATDYSKEKNLVFVLLHYGDFENQNSFPDVWVVPAKVAEELKRPWLNDTSAIYFSN